MDRRTALTAIFGALVTTMAAARIPAEATPAALPRLTPLIGPEGAPAPAVATERDLDEARIEEVQRSVRGVPGGRGGGFGGGRFRGGGGGMGRFRGGGGWAGGRFRGGPGFGPRRFGGGYWRGGPYGGRRVVVRRWGGYGWGSPGYVDPWPGYGVARRCRRVWVPTPWGGLRRVWRCRPVWW